MRSSSEDTDRTTRLTRDAAAYAARPGSDQEFVTVLHSAFLTEIAHRAAGLYPPPGHDTTTQDR